MFNKERVKELGLIIRMNSFEACGNTIAMPSRCKTDDNCSFCSDVCSAEHYEIIEETGEFTCTDCSVITDILELVQPLNCSICKEKIRKYIREDFTDVFNNLGDKDETK